MEVERVSSHGRYEVLVKSADSLVESPRSQEDDILSAGQPLTQSVRKNTLPT